MEANETTHRLGLQQHEELDSRNRNDARDEMLPSAFAGRFLFLSSPVLLIPFFSLSFLLHRSSLLSAQAS